MTTANDGRWMINLRPWMTNLRLQMNYHDTFTSCQDRWDWARFARFLSALPWRVFPYLFRPPLPNPPPPGGREQESKSLVEQEHQHLAVRERQHLMGPECQHLVPPKPSLGAWGLNEYGIPLIVALLVFPLLTGCGEETPKLENGQAAPAFALPDLAGKTWQLPGDFQGQVVALRFWADWCPFCAPEMRAIEPLYQELHAQGLRVLAVNVRQDRETAARFVAGLGISYATLLDEDGAVARQYGVSGLPTTYFIDRAGKIHTRILGEAKPELFGKIVREML